ncbi:hypothetical protein L2E82_47907 [Cichorium intybus]|uniref:Uncharacterized protein n=1 Tax=Cichorium intybus TaxID=13427 RepID=A0ACB8YXW8_CICIN|nr:hypothetical protein L2E82_47907 [Cichorium intybus]
MNLRLNTLPYVFLPSLTKTLKQPLSPLPFYAAVCSFHNHHSLLPPGHGYHPKAAILNQAPPNWKVPYSRSVEVAGRRWFVRCSRCMRRRWNVVREQARGRSSGA